MSLPGPARRIVVEPIEVPRPQEVPQEDPEPVEVPERQPEREKEPVPA